VEQLLKVAQKSTKAEGDKDSNTQQRV